MIPLIWSDEASQDLDGIYEYIARTSSYYAQRTIERIIQRGKQIAAFPQSGRPFLNIRIPGFGKSLKDNIV